MAIFTTADGRQIVGAAQAGNEYKGYAGRREIVIQLTETGATQDSLDALEFLKSYAVYNNSVGKPIFPASTNVFISNNGVTKAVEADEVTVDGASVNIGGCVWNGTAWDFTNAGQSGGGGSSGGGVLVVHDEEDTLDKTWQEIHDAFVSGGCVISLNDGNAVQNVTEVSYSSKGGSYNVRTYDNLYKATASTGYPQLNMS
jgi:hypothetical protein